MRTFLRRVERVVDTDFELWPDAMVARDAGIAPIARVQSLETGPILPPATPCIRSLIALGKLAVFCLGMGMFVGWVAWEVTRVGVWQECEVHFISLLRFSHLPVRFLSAPQESS